MRELWICVDFRKNRYARHVQLAAHMFITNDSNVQSEFVYSLIRRESQMELTNASLDFLFYVSTV